MCSFLSAPGSRGGLASKDRIVKIGDGSTRNMPLEEAVSRLRGAPGSTVTVWIVREGTRGWQKPRRFDVVRAVIHIAAKLMVVVALSQYARSASVCVSKNHPMSIVALTTSTMRVRLVLREILPTGRLSLPVRCPPYTQ